MTDADRRRTAVAILSTIEGFVCTVDERDGVTLIPVITCYHLVTRVLHATRHAPDRAERVNRARVHIRECGWLVADLLAGIGERRPHEMSEALACLTQCFRAEAALLGVELTLDHG